MYLPANVFVVQLFLEMLECNWHCSKEVFIKNSLSLLIKESPEHFLIYSVYRGQFLTHPDPKISFSLYRIFWRLLFSLLALDSAAALPDKQKNCFSIFPNPNCQSAKPLTRQSARNATISFASRAFNDNKIRVFVNSTFGAGRQLSPAAKRGSRGPSRDIEHLYVNRKPLPWFALTMITGPASSVKSLRTAKYLTC